MSRGFVGEDMLGQSSKNEQCCEGDASAATCRFVFASTRSPSSWVAMIEQGGSTSSDGWLVVDTGTWEVVETIQTGRSLRAFSMDSSGNIYFLEPFAGSGDPAGGRQDAK